MSGKNKITRRDFIKATGLTALGGILVACTPSRPFSLAATPLPTTGAAVQPTSSAAATSTVLPNENSQRFGSTGKLLFVDLTSGKIRTEILPNDLYRLYPGGKALAAYLLLKNQPPNADPLGPENVLVFSTGLLTGTSISTAASFTVAARSPLTGCYGESESGGYWGTELKKAGYEAIVVTGKSALPVYLLVKDAQVEIRSANHLWGQSPEFVDQTVRQELMDNVASVLQIGLGGENLVLYAAISHNMRHYNARSGMGAVMGSKNLKAIVARGSGDLTERFFDAAGILSLSKSLSLGVQDNPQSLDLQVRGTPGLTSEMDAAGILPTRNFRQGTFEGVNNLAWDAYKNNLFKERGVCHACAVGCKREAAIDARWKVSGVYGGPEYETVAGFGSNCGVDDLSAVAKANEVCSRYILDPISTSATIAFAMECFEKGLISLQDTGGVDLRFGNAEAMLQMIELIAKRSGFGAQLAEGTRSLSKKIGQGSEQFAMHVKGQELGMHDPRGKVGVGLGYALSEIGADHLASYHDTLISTPDSVTLKSVAPLGIIEAIPARELSARKAAAYFTLENWSSLIKTIGFCYFGPAPRGYVQVDQVVTAVRAATGWDVGVGDLLQVGERATNLARIFNVREGFSRKDDTLPERLFMPLENGVLQGVGISKSEFSTTLDEVYRCKGWDPTSTIPYNERLALLKIEWAGVLL